MSLDGDACYRALAARDARFDGLFFVGVSSTGIYCRPVCTARLPRRENCTFFPNAASAEKACYRPCLLCRPEIAPGRARVDAMGRLASFAVRRIEDGALGEMSLSDLANELGVSDRHLRRSVLDQYGVSPVELVQTQRLLTAKRLLTDTALPIGEVAFTSGFSSLRRFNTLFRERYRLSPTELRKSATRNSQDQIRCEIGFRPPYDLTALLAFLEGRAIPRVERVAANRYIRTVRIGERQGWIAVSLSSRQHALSVEVSPSLASALPQVLARVRRLFDTCAEPEPIEACLGPLVTHPGLRLPGAFDAFEMAVRAILGQQVSVRAARTLAGRLVAQFGDTIETPHDGLDRLFPPAERLAQVTPDEIVHLGITRSRTKALLGLAEAIASGQLRLTFGSDPDETIRCLIALPGIGDWTAQYIVMRALSWPDAFPHTDLGIQKALGEKNPRRVLERAEAWRPWRAYAVMHLWKSSEETP